MTKYKNSVRITKESVRKKYNKNILDIYEIFELSGLENYPKIITYDDREIEYEYIEKHSVPLLPRISIRSSLCEL